LLRYIYGCELPKFDGDVTHIKELIDIANKYGVTNLILQAKTKYASSTMKLNSENLLENLQFADAKNCALLRELPRFMPLRTPWRLLARYH
jgi:hypothetical protein